MEVEDWFEAAIEWPVGVGAKRNEGVAKSVARTEGAIGYVEYATAEQHQLTHAAMVNKAGKIVAPSMQSFQAAAANADWKSVPGYGLMLTDQPGDGSWPITAASFILMHIVAQDAASSGAALKFFDWAYRNGDAMAEALSYVPMPDNVVGLVQGQWTKIKDPAGKPVFAMN